MFKDIVKDLYESIIETNKPRLTILEAAKNVFEGKVAFAFALSCAPFLHLFISILPSMPATRSAAW